MPMVSHPNRLMAQHLAHYRSAAEKRTIKRSDPMPRYQLHGMNGRVLMIGKVLVGAVGAVIFP